MLCGTVFADSYTADFNTAITTSDHAFQVASNWRHIVGIGNYDGNGPYYMSYSYSYSDGIDGSHTLVAYKQYAGDYEGGEVVKDVLVTPVISGEVTMFVKVSGLASTSYPSFVEFYNVDQNGTTLGEQIHRFTATEYVESEIEGWSTITINLDSPKRIGIRAQYVYMDNFSATSAELVKETKLTISNVTSPTGSTPVYYSQKEDGTVDINVKVKLKNEGEVDLVAGETENYSLSLVKGAYYGSNNTVYDNVKFDIPVDIAIGEEAEVDAVFNAPADFGTGWFYVKVKENITGSISYAKVQAQVKEYESKFVFDKAGTSYSNNPSATTTQIVFGKIMETTTLNYEIYNAGSAPLVINSFTLPEGFISNVPEGEFTVIGGEKKQIDITLPADNFGVFVGDLVIEYTNYGKDMATYTLGISGSVLDSSKNLITFDDGAGNAYYPQGSVRYSVYISSEGSGDTKNYYLRDNSSGSIAVEQGKPAKPKALFRVHPARTSNAQFIQDMVNAVEVVDGEQMQLHMLTFDTELDNTMTVQKGGSWIDKQSLELKAFHNEEDGQAYTNLESVVQNFIVTWNFIYTGTPMALKKKVNAQNFGSGLATRLTCIPLPSTNFEMMERERRVDFESDGRMKEWAFKLDRMKGELTVQKIVDELYDWTARRMMDAKENDSKADEMLLKRCAYHGLNFAAPFIVMRHWANIRQEGDYWCGEFETDDTDWRLAELIVTIQYACQRHYFGALAEKYFDDKTRDAAANVQRRGKTIEAYNRLPDTFTVDDVMRCFSLSNYGSARTRVVRLQKDRLVEKVEEFVENGTTKARYRKTGAVIL